MGWFSRKKKTETPEEMLARFHADQVAQRNEAAAVQAASTTPGSGNMPVEDVFNITGRGLVVTGRIASGHLRVGAPVQIHGADGSVQTSSVKAIEMFRKVVTEAGAGENVGVLFTSRVTAERGSRLTF